MLLDTLSTKAFTARALVESGMFSPTRPDRLVRVVKALRDWGPTIAGGYAANAIRFPDATAIIDEHGALTFGELHRRTNALAHAWSDDGIVEGDAIALLCRNHRGFVEALVAASKLGAHALFLNTAFSAPQLARVCDSEDPRALVLDEEFGALVEAVLDLTDWVCEDLNIAQKARVGEAFLITSRYEWMFWDAAWRLEKWPVG